MRLKDVAGTSRLSLSAQVQLLVCVPIVVLFVFGALLVHLELDAEAAARNAVEARNIVEQINKINTDILQIVSLTNSTRSRQWKQVGYKGYLLKPFRAAVVRMRDEYAELDRLTKNHPDLNQAVYRSRRALIGAIQVLEEMSAALKRGDAEEVISAIRKTDKLADFEEEFISSELLLVAKSEEDFANRSTQRQADIRRAIVNYTLIMIVLNAIFCIFAARYLVKTITSRLRIMSENAGRLAANQALHNPLGGADEIAQLDRTFHGMAEELDRAKQARQDLFNMVTHDLRTPLTVIQGCLEVLDRDRKKKTDQKDERTDKLVKVATRNCDRTMGLVGDLLNSEKIQAGMLTLQTAELKLTDVFEDVRLSMSDWMAEKGVKFEVAPCDLTVKADRELLSRVIFNLLSNSLKYAPKGSTISLAATNAQSSEANLAEITVTDQGIGIPKEQLKSIFDRFRQVEGETESEKGTGLGLAICKDFVELHGGTIWAKSELGSGSTFHFTVPLNTSQQGLSA